MIKIENIVTPSSKQWKSAIMGARNAYNSWDRSDSAFYCWDKYGEFCKDECSYYGGPHICKLDPEDEFLMIGPNDLKLLHNLAKAGDDHGKFARMLPVYMDVTAPLYLFKEMDTYRIGTVCNSCSTMHKIAAKEFTLEDFSCEHLFDDYSLEDQLTYGGSDIGDDDFCYTSKDALQVICDILNHHRFMYLETKDKKYWWQIIQLLPSSYNQKRTYQFNYQVLYHIYDRRKTHKLDEWHTFCDVIEKLPYFKEIYLEGQA